MKNRIQSVAFARLLSFFTKARVYFFLGLFSCINSVVAQAQWDLTGNNTTTGFIGITNLTHSFNIYTSNSPSVEIDPAGNVYILKSGAILDVDGDINLSGNLSMTGLPVLSIAGTQNIFVGQNSGFSITTGTGNSFIGYQAGYNTDEGSENVFVGFQAGYDNTENYRNTFIGFESGKSSTGNRNSFLGYGSGSENNGGEDNIFIGIDAGKENTSANCNTFIGNYNASLNEGSNNSFVGYKSAYLNTTGHSNSFFGAETGLNNEDGNENVFSGFQAGNNNISGSKNTFVGNKAGQVNTGSNNTYLGYNANGSASLTNAAAIGYNASVTASNSLVLGGTGADAVNVGIGVTAPAYTLEVNGTIAAKQMLITTDDKTQDLLALIVELQNEVHALKQQLTAAK